tara:strand:- start:2793 stop:3185 length:393 start_codon:yes stop_codon:yes gene_type:complete
MTSLKKAWTYVKNYWYVPVIAIMGAFLFLATRDNNNVFFQMFRNALERNKKDLEEIEKNNAIATKAQRDAEARAAKQVEDIKKEYDKRKKELEQDKQERFEELMKKSDDPEKLAKELAKITGWKYIPPSD